MTTDDPDCIGYNVYLNRKLIKRIRFEQEPVYIMYWSSGQGSKWRIELRSTHTSPLYDAEQRWMIP